MNRLKTLVIVTPGFPANEADSTCLPPRQTFVRSLKQASPELNVIVLTLQYPFFSREYEWFGVKVISFGGENTGRLFRLFTYLRVWITLKRLNKEFELIGLLSFWLGKCAWIADRFSKNYRLKHFCWLLGQDAKIGNKYVRRIKPEGRNLIALSDFIKREFNKNYGIMPHHVVPVGIDAAVFSAGSLTRDIDVLGVGSLIPLKQYHVFLEIIKTLTACFPRIKATICGDGKEMKSLREMVTKLNLEDNVSLIGRLPHPEVLELMQRSKILLHTSSYEGFGTVNLEALCAGAKVVSFVKPMDEELKNWYQADAQEQLAGIIKQLLHDPLISFESIIPYPAVANAEVMLQLFGYKAAIS